MLRSAHHSLGRHRRKARPVEQVEDRHHPRTAIRQLPVGREHDNWSTDAVGIVADKPDDLHPLLIRQTAVEYRGGKGGGLRQLRKLPGTSDGSPLTSRIDLRLVSPEWTNMLNVQLGIGQ